MESVTQFAATFRNHILRSGAAAGDEAIKINMFIRALYDRGCQFHVRQAECTSIDDAVRQAEMWEDAFRPTLSMRWPMSYQGGAMAAARQARSATPFTYAAQSYYMPPSVSSPPQRMPYMMPGEYVPVPPAPGPTLPMQYPKPSVSSTIVLTTMVMWISLSPAACSGSCCTPWRIVSTIRSLSTFRLL